MLQGAAAFVGPREVAVGDRRIRARRFVVATGSSPAIPPLPGLADIDFLTNETVFDRVELPPRLLAVGGGPIGLELAQAFRRLGAEVAVFEMARALAADDPEIAELVVNRLRREGIAIHENARVVRVERSEGGVRVVAETADGEIADEGSDLLVAAGRAANVEGLGLERAGIDYSPRGIRVDARLRTTNRRVFAIGDVAARLQFTHVAAYQASVVLRNALFPFAARARHRNIPWVTYTDPELAHVGLHEGLLDGRRRGLRVLRWPFAENDRAAADRDTDGLVKVVTGRRGRILGATIVGPHAGELIAPWVLALENNLGIGALARAVAPYPTYGEVSKRAAGSYYTPSLFGPRMRKIVRWLSRLP